MAEKIEKERAVRAETMVVEAKQEAMQNCLNKIIQQLHASTQKAQELTDNRLQPSNQLELYLFECQNAEELARQTLQDMNNVFEALKQQLKEGMPLDSLVFPTEPQIPTPLQPPQEFIEKPKTQNVNQDELVQIQQTDPSTDLTILKPVVMQREPPNKVVMLRLLVSRQIPCTETEFKSGTQEVRAEAGPDGLGLYREWGLEVISQMIVEKIRSARSNKKRRSRFSKVATEWVDEVGEGSEETCCICMDTLTTQDKDMHRCKGCKALYHQWCLKSWLDTNSVHRATCPKCRRGIKMVIDLLEF